MKEIKPKLRAFKNAMEISSENTVVFENCTTFQKYNTPDKKYETVLNLCEQNNYILNEIIPYLKSVSKVKLYTEDEAEPFYGKPMKLSYDLFGLTDYWWIILAVNGYFVSQDFTGWTRLILPEKADMETILDRVLYANPDIGKQID